MLLLALVAFRPAMAQKYFSGRNEVGWSLGVSNYHGDISHGLNMKGFHLAGGLYYKRNWSGYFTNRLQLSYLKISGTDKGDRSYAARNLSFKTPIYEFAEMVEFNFRRFGMNFKDDYWSPYFFTGLAGFMFDPTREENSNVKLRNLRTEGQSKGYSLFQPALPIGFGIKTMLHQKKNQGVWIFGVEGFWRKTFTDHLDDVGGSYPDYKTMVDKQGIGSAQYSHAQTLNGGTPYTAGTDRGDTHLKDWYYFIGFTMAFRFPGGVCYGM